MDNLFSEARSAELAGGHGRSVEGEGSEDTDTAAMHWSEVYCGWSTGKACDSIQIPDDFWPNSVCVRIHLSMFRHYVNIVLFTDAIFLVWVHNYSI